MTAPPPRDVLAVSHPGRRVYGHVYPVVVMRHSREDPRQSHLAAGGPVGHEADELGPGLATVDD